MTSSDLDRIAEQAVADLRRFAPIWRDGGAAALDAAVRADSDQCFAVRDERTEGGVLRLVTARAGADLVFSFAVLPDGRRAIVACTDSVVLRADPALQQIAVGPQDNRLAEELAWRLAVGVDADAVLPVGFASAPGGPRWRGAIADAALLRALSAARRMLEGALPFVAGAHDVHFALREAGIEPTPHTLYYIHHESDPVDAVDPGRGADLEAWSRIHGRADCEALLAQYQGSAFAESDR